MSEDDSNDGSDEDGRSEPEPILRAQVTTNSKNTDEDGDWETLSESDEE
jgi:hypothetical protein